MDEYLCIDKQQCLPQSTESAYNNIVLIISHNRKFRGGNLLCFIH